MTASRACRHEDGYGYHPYTDYVKLFNHSDYVECSKLIRVLKQAILEETHPTEKNDFAVKHKDSLFASFASVIERMDAFNQWIGERILKTAQALIPVFERLGKMALYIRKGYADSSKVSFVSTDQEE